MDDEKFTSVSLSPIREVDMSQFVRTKLWVKYLYISDLLPYIPLLKNSLRLSFVSNGSTLCDFQNLILLSFDVLNLSFPRQFPSINLFPSRTAFPLQQRIYPLSLPFP